MTVCYLAIKLLFISLFKNNFNLTKISFLHTPSSFGMISHSFISFCFPYNTTVDKKTIWIQPLLPGMINQIIKSRNHHLSNFFMTFFELLNCIKNVFLFDNFHSNGSSTLNQDYFLIDVMIYFLIAETNTLGGFGKPC